MDKGSHYKDLRKNNTSKNMMQLTVYLNTNINDYFYDSNELKQKKKVSQLANATSHY